MNSLEAANAIAAALRAIRPEHVRPITVHKLTPDGRSWLVHAERFWPMDKSALEATWAARPTEATRGVIMGRTVDFPRRTRAYGVDYKYTGQVQRSAPMNAAPAPVCELVSALTDNKQLFGDHNALLLNFYRADDGEYMGAHSDDEKELVPLVPVVSLSWTAPVTHYRRFRFTARKNVADALTPDAWGFGAGCLPLRNGCLVVMGGECQRTHKHELMKPTKALAESSGRRINLTLRQFAAGAELASRKRQRLGDSSARASPEMQPAAAVAAAKPAHKGAAGVGAADGDGAPNGDGAAWTCTECTFVHTANEAAFLCCKVCCTQRHGPGSSSSSAPASSR